MNESQISVRYAKALFHLAEENRVLDRINQDMELLSETCRMEDFRYLLALPSLQASRKQIIVESVLKAHVNEESMSMIGLVIKNNREVYLPAIARNFGDLYRKAKNIRSASFVTAAAVGNEVIEHIRKLVSDTYQSEVDLNTDLRYDASVSGSLRKMKKQLLKSSTENR